MCDFASLIQGTDEVSDGRCDGECDGHTGRRRRDLSSSRALAAGIRNVLAECCCSCWKRRRRRVDGREGEVEGMVNTSAVPATAMQHFVGCRPCVSSINKVSKCWSEDSSAASDTVCGGPPFHPPVPRDTDA